MCCSVSVLGRHLLIWIRQVVFQTARRTVSVALPRNTGSVATLASRILDEQDQGGREGPDLLAMVRRLFALGLFAALSAPAHAEMCRVGMMTTLNLCKRCPVDFSASTRRDTGCTGAFSVGFGTNVSSGAGNLANLDAKLHAKPQHGSLAIQGQGSS